ncbi:MAG: metallophosphoesterase family protein [Methanomicrobiaceae archaeon]|nr:metallophosphoesterase family protein [Methanomicrobiaceae archaeon]
MNRELRIALDLSHFHYRISERMKEIGNSIDYNKIFSRPEIILFSIDCTEKNPEKQVMEIIKEASSEISYLPFLIDGFVKRTPDKIHGLSLKIEASPGIIQLHDRLKELLIMEGMKFQSFMYDKNRLYLPLMEYPGFLDAEIIWRHVSRKNCDPLTRLLSLAGNSPRYKIRDFILPAESFRIQLCDEKEVLKVYDLVLKRSINGNDVHRAREGFENFRRMRGYESVETKYSETKDSFIISDLHLSHKSITEGAARPFYPGDSKRMDEVLIRNWNNTVKPSDTIYYLGDLTYNLGPDICNNYLSKLNGELVFIRGNHDSCLKDYPEQLLVNYSGREYLLVHDPKFRPKDYSGWMIHGHVHNSRVADYPFIDFKNKTINACCELTGYHPVNLRDIHRVLEKHEKGMTDARRFFLYEEISGEK